MINSFFVIFFYIFASFISLAIIRHREKVACGLNVSGNKFKDRNGVFVPFYGVILISFLFVICNFVATRMKPEFTGDRLIYYLNYRSYRDTPSIGLNAIILFLRRFTNNPEILFYFSTFFTVALTIIAFNVSKDTTTFAFLFLFSSQYIFNSFSVLKQSYANSFAVLSIVLFLEALNGKKKNYIFGAVSILLGILFHHTAYFLIPVCVFLCLKKSKLSIYIYSLFMIVLFLYFDEISLFLSRVISPVVPVVSMKINQYVFEARSDQSAVEGLTYIKGIPFYIISIIGFFERKRLIKAINNYDNYLILSLMLSFCYLTTIYNGWIYRFAYFFYLPVGIFFSLLINHMNNKNNRIILSVVVIGLTLLLTFRFVVLMFINYGGF